MRRRWSTVASTVAGGRECFCSNLGSSFRQLYFCRKHFTSWCKGKAGCVRVHIYACLRFRSHYAQIYINPIFGHLKGEGTVTAGGQTVTFDVSESGFADPIVNFKFGLIGTPPLKLPEFAKTPQRLQLSALASFSIPIGEYDGERFINLGTNIWAIRLGTPFVAPLIDPRRPWLLEVIPSITFFSDNDDPTGDATVREEDPLFAIETHLTHNFTPKFWAGVDLRYRYGGETTTDGIADDNKSDVLGGGFTLGYSITPKTSVQATYGNVLTENDGSELEMIRVKVVIMF
ncbi:transporter [bacterium]|nr:transporter [bacterium]MCI0616466.1 transporter [bacterium]